MHIEFATIFTAFLSTTRSNYDTLLGRLFQISSSAVMYVQNMMIWTTSLPHYRNRKCQIERHETWNLTNAFLPYSLFTKRNKFEYDDHNHSGKSFLKPLQHAHWQLWGVALAHNQSNSTYSSSTLILKTLYDLFMDCS